MTNDQHEQLVVIMLDLECMATSWEGEIFTRDHYKTLSGTADTLGLIVKEIRQGKQS